MAKRRRRRKRGAMYGRSGFAGLALLLVLAVAAGVIVSRVFVVRTINVVGNGAVPVGDVIQLSGIEIGQSSLRLNEERVRANFDGLGKLSFEGIEVDMPSTVTIKVRERVGRVLINYSGLPTVLDEYGYALEQSREAPDIDLPMVTGLKLSQCQVGKKVQSEVPSQVEAMCTVVQQIYAQQLNAMVSELNVQDLDNLYLMTRSGMMVRLGDAEKMQDKLLWMTSALQQLTSEGITTGIVSVAGGSSATYQPAQTQQSGE